MKIYHKERVFAPKKQTVSDLMSLLGFDTLDKIVEETKSDKWVIKLLTKDVFLLIVYSLLENHRLSLRILAENYSCAGFKAVMGSEKDEMTLHTSIRDRLAKINVGFFEGVYDQTCDLLVKRFSQKQLAHYNIKRYDSTMVAVFSHLMQGMKVGNTTKKKNQVKLSTELVNGFEVRMRFFKDQDHLGEEVALKELIQSQTHSPSDLIVFDRGIKSRATFCELKSQQTKFVTRLNDKNRYKLLRSHENPAATAENKTLIFVQDSIVYLYGDGHKLVEEEFRLVEVISKKTNKKLFFLTNILDLSAEQIAEIYHMRWDIEVFFRFMKQEMSLAHFVSYDLNAIQVMIYATLITAMLVLVYKKENDLASYKLAKKQFSMDFESALILKLIETPQGLDLYRRHLQRQIKMKQALFFEKVPRQKV